MTTKERKTLEMVRDLLSSLLEENNQTKEKSVTPTLPKYKSSAQGDWEDIMRGAIPRKYE